MANEFAHRFAAAIAIHREIGGDPDGVAVNPDDLHIGDEAPCARGRIFGVTVWSLALFQHNPDQPLLRGDPFAPSASTADPSTTDLANSIPSFWPLL
jgi:hypothetical protein